MIRIDFTDAEGKYAGSVYTNEFGLTEASLQERLTALADLWGVEGRKDESFADYLCRAYDGFMPKTATVFHFQVLTKPPYGV